MQSSNRSSYGLNFCRSASWPQPLEPAIIVLLHAPGMHISTQHAPSAACDGDSVRLAGSRALPISCTANQMSTGCVRMVSSQPCLCLYRYKRRRGRSAGLGSHQSSEALQPGDKLEPFDSARVHEMLQLSRCFLLLLACWQCVLHGAFGP